MYFDDALSGLPHVLDLQLPDGTVVPMNYGDKVPVPKWLLPQLSEQFRPSLLSLPLGARAVYRDGYAQDSLQVRDYGSYWEFELDRYNPEAGPVEFVGHGLLDAPLVTLGVVGGLALAGHLLG